MIILRYYLKNMDNYYNNKELLLWTILFAHVLCYYVFKIFILDIKLYHARILDRHRHELTFQFAFLLL